MIKIKTALTIAGFDPTGGAGIQSDIRVFNKIGIYGTSVISAITAQNSYSVKSIQPVSLSFFERQLCALIEDIKPDAIKTGMLYSSDIVKTTAKVILKYNLKPLVIDPVIKSSTGKILIQKDMIKSLNKYLLPLAKVITPNIFEASILSGINIRCFQDMKNAAISLKNLGVDTVIITGGHFDSIGNKNFVLGLIYNGKDFYELKNKKIVGQYHGTGCVFSAALTAFLAKGHNVITSVIEADRFVYKAIKGSQKIGKGMKFLNV